MWPFTYGLSTPHRHTLWVWGSVLGAHVLWVYALWVLAPQVQLAEKSVALEMVLSPTNPTVASQPKVQAAATAQSASPKTLATQTAASKTTAPISVSEATTANASANSPAHAPAAPVTPAPAAPAAPALQLPSAQGQGLNNPRPTYPAVSRRLNEQGQVVVRVYVGTDGVAQQGDIKTSSGYDRLDQEALRTVMRWRFVPGQRLGVPEAMWFNVPVNFVLE